MDFGAIWIEERRILPLASVVLVLIFARARLYTNGKRRGHAARVIGSTAIATVIVAALVIAAGNDFTTYYVFYASFLAVAALSRSPSGPVTRASPPCTST